jgi:hypothetical protein
VEHDAATVTWRGFGHQIGYRPYDEGDTIRRLGPFVFDRRTYRAALVGLHP